MLYPVRAQTCTAEWQRRSVLLKKELRKDGFKQWYSLFSLYIVFNSTGLPRQRVVGDYQQWITKVRFGFLRLLIKCNLYTFMYKKNPKTPLLVYL